MTKHPVRKTIRLKDYNYNTPGYYFITLCTKDKQKLLGDIVGTGLPDGPMHTLSSYGQIVDHQLKTMSGFYEDIKLEKYVVMPNHVHLLLHIPGTQEPRGPYDAANSKVALFVGTFKRFCGRQIPADIWQRRSHDHIIRGEADYRKIWEYIDQNPIRWAEDCFYSR